MTTTTDRIMTIWQWCHDAYLRRGRRLSFPKKTDPTKTYQWRYLEALERRLSEWGFDDDLAKRFIDVAAAYASERGLMAKGLAIFFQSNILAVCYRRLQEELVRIDQTLDTIGRAQSFVQQQAGQRSLQAAMLARASLGAYSNIVQWYQAGHITDLYVALSKSAMASLAQLAKTRPSERLILPAATTLFIVRSSFLRESGVRQKAMNILQDDWRTT